MARSDYHVAMKVEEQEVSGTLSTRTDLPNLKVETQNLVKSYMQDHELHTRDHARGELRLRSEARPAQLTWQARERARDEQLRQQARYQVSLQLQDHQN